VSKLESTRRRSEVGPVQRSVTRQLSTWPGGERRSRQASVRKTCSIRISTRLDDCGGTSPEGWERLRRGRIGVNGCSCGHDFAALQQAAKDDETAVRLVSSGGLMGENGGRACSAAVRALVGGEEDRAQVPGERRQPVVAVGGRAGERGKRPGEGGDRGRGARWDRPRSSRPELGAG
jgi:hypothetical protein